MKRIAKLIAVVSTMTVLFAMPVFAAVPSTPEQLRQIEEMNRNRINRELADLIVKANGNPDGPQWSGHRKDVERDMAMLNRDTERQFIELLQNQVGAKMEMERVKLEILNNYQSLAQCSPEYAAKVPQALADYQASVADTQAAKALVAYASAMFGIPAK